MAMIARWLLIVFVPALMSACVCSSPKAPFPELNGWLEKNRLAVSTGKDEKLDYNGAFTQGSIIAYGEGKPAANASGPGQKRLTAVRAAEVVAKRNLAKFLAQHGVNGELSFDASKVKLDAFLKGAVVVASEYDTENERAAALVRLDLNGAKGFSEK
ncbi:MAG: hypothetical protein WCP33_02920 [Deltaproteobacteria bacterium]